MTDAPLLDIQAVTYRYGEEITAIDSLSLQLQRDERLVLLGQNGAGKTTLAKLMAGLLEPDSGRVLINGQDLHSLPVGQRARMVSYVFQNPDHQIFSATVRQELAFGPSKIGLRGEELEQRVARTLAQFDLEGVADQAPATLSYGLRRKISIAAVAALHSPILILDEPTLGLDWGSATDMLNRIVGMESSLQALILISHDLEMIARYADQASLLDQGRLIIKDNLASLLKDADLLDRFGMNPPPISDLAATLRDQGLPIDTVEVEAFARAVGRILKERQA